MFPELHYGRKGTHSTLVLVSTVTPMTYTQCFCDCGGVRGIDNRVGAHAGDKQEEKKAKSSSYMKNSIDKLSKLKIKKQHYKHALWGHEDKYKKKHLKAKSGALREREMRESAIIKEPCSTIRVLKVYVLEL